MGRSYEHCSRNQNGYLEVEFRAKRRSFSRELFAANDAVDDADLEAALQRGLEDVAAGRVRPVEEVKAMIPQWISKS